jgi:hypothetical protein
MSAAAYMGVELTCRTLLMYVAVEKGAKEGQTCAHYVDWLQKQGYITPTMKGWVDLVRQHGNKSGHTLEMPTKERAESTVMFLAELLRVVYEMEHLAKQYVAKEQAGGGDAEAATTT